MTDTYKKGTIARPEWIHTDYFEYWLKDFIRDGTCLNMCSGQSMIGDVRVDIDPNSNRTIDGNLFNSLEMFNENQFDYVYCDPDFKVYTTGENRMQWQFDLFKIARIALITRRPKVAINMPSIYHEYVIAEDSRTSLSLIRIDWKKSSRRLV